MDTGTRQKKQDDRFSFEEDRFLAKALRRKEVSDSTLEMVFQLVSVKEKDLKKVLQDEMI